METAVAESRHALDLATGRYERGLTEFLNVVDAERELYAKEDERIVAQEAVALQFVLLYKALGGGWERYELLPPIREPEPAIVAMFRRLSNQWQYRSCSSIWCWRAFSLTLWRISLKTHCP